MKLSDYVVEFLADEGIEHVFGLTGGAVVHLFDSAARNPRVQPVFNHHEQAAAYAAEAYARLRNNLGAAFVTTGPGGTNAITGLCAAWLDSIPTIYVSGQTRLAHTSHGEPIRQLGAQEFDIVTLVSPLTKFAVMVDDPSQIRYYLQKAVHIARTGRPGPVWVDIPQDIQWSSIEPDDLRSFDPSEMPTEGPRDSLATQVAECLRLMGESERPMVLAGYGVRLAHAEDEFRRLVEELGLPFLTTWSATDLLPSDSDLYLGRPGTLGQRGANLAVQNCDLLLTLGSHLSVAITGTMFDAFAREAKKIMVDIDPVELGHRTVRVDLPIESDVRVFLQAVLERSKDVQMPDISPWRAKCSLYSGYNAIPEEWRRQQQNVNPYVFVDVLCDELDERDIIVVDGGGTANQTTFQSVRLKAEQRILISCGLCAMGSGLPESIGACFAGGGRRTVCLSGDGSAQLNIQELQTVVHHDLPVKIFVLENAGYLSIRNTQDTFLEGRHAGSAREGDMSLPDVVKVAEAYGLKATRIHHHQELRERIRWVLDTPGPVMCGISVSRHQPVIPRQGFDTRPDGTGVPRPLEDMYPFLDREEFREAMVIEPYVEPHSSGRGTDGGDRDV